MADGFEVVVARRSAAADGVALLELARPDGSPLPAWAPGAHVDVLLPGGLGERQYSLCGDPADRRTWTVGVLAEPGGRGGSVHLHGLAEGDRLRLRGPSNHFAFRPAPGAEHLFVAGGIGITPLKAMIAAAEEAGVAWRLVYAGRSRATMAFLPDLVDRYGDRVDVYAADEGRRADLAGLLAAAPEAIVYCCGPAQLIAAVEEACADRPADRLHLERFEAKQVAAPVWTEPFEVELLLSGITITVPPERSILEVAEEAGVLALSSCRVGTCGTCETPVVSGAIDHRDSVLTPGEQEDDWAMMICVSRAACPRITLEL